jgi:glycerophosphoryl diester phosphodiesterase
MTTKLNFTSTALMASPAKSIVQIMEMVIICAIINLSLASTGVAAHPVRPLPNAHAHNDYEHPRPLLDALDQGFTSVEADIFLVDGQLLVAHDLKDVLPERTLENLYLSPLRETIIANGGTVYPSGEGMTLLVDVKRDGAAVYAELEKLFQKYSDIISVTIDGVYYPKAVTIIISGDRPIAEIIASNPRHVGIDGRLSDLESDWPASLLPLISDNWRLHFRFRSREEFSEMERQKLDDIVRKAHERGRRIRFWATPDTESMWSILQKANVDLIGTDNLVGLNRFLNAHSQ